MRTIDADALLLTVSIKSVFGNDVNVMKCGELRTILEMIENAPTVEPPQKWIPVTPDSPPLYMPVLTWDGGTRHVEQRIPYIRDEIGEKIFNDWWIDGDEKWDEWAEYQPNLRDGCAIKWMPLPEPYREGGQDDES